MIELQSVLLFALDVVSGPYVHCAAPLNPFSAHAGLNKSTGPQEAAAQARPSPPPSAGALVHTGSSEEVRQQHSGGGGHADPHAGSSFRQRRGLFAESQQQQRVSHNQHPPLTPLSVHALLSGSTASTVQSSGQPLPSRHGLITGQSAPQSATSTPKLRGTAGSFTDEGTSLPRGAQAQPHGDAATTSPSKAAAAAAAAAGDRMGGFSDIFIPRPEFCRRVMWLHPAESGRLYLYYPEEIPGEHYSRKTLRYSLCFVFQVDSSLMTIGEGLIRKLLQPYSVVLTNVAEELRNAEVKYGYISMGLCPRAAAHHEDGSALPDEGVRAHKVTPSSSYVVSHSSESIHGGIPIRAGGRAALIHSDGGGASVQSSELSPATTLSVQNTRTNQQVTHGQWPRSQSESGPYHTVHPPPTINTAIAVDGVFPAVMPSSCSTPLSPDYYTTTTNSTGSTNNNNTSNTRSATNTTTESHGSASAGGAAPSSPHRRINNNQQQQPDSISEVNFYSLGSTPQSGIPQSRAVGAGGGGVGSSSLLLRHESSFVGAEFRSSQGDRCQSSWYTSPDTVGLTNSGGGGGDGGTRSSSSHRAQLNCFVTPHSTPRWTPLEELVDALYQCLRDPSHSEEGHDDPDGAQQCPSSMMFLSSPRSPVTAMFATNAPPFPTDSYGTNAITSSSQQHNTAAAAAAAATSSAPQSPTWTIKTTRSANQLHATAFYGARASPTDADLGAAPLPHDGGDAATAAAAGGAPAAGVCVGIGKKVVHLSNSLFFHVRRMDCLQTAHAIHLEEVPVPIAVVQTHANFQYMDIAVRHVLELVDGRRTVADIVFSLVMDTSTTLSDIYQAAHRRPSETDPAAAAAATTAASTLVIDASRNRGNSITQVMSSEGRSELSSLTSMPASPSRLPESAGISRPFGGGVASSAPKSLRAPMATAMMVRLASTPRMMRHNSLVAAAAAAGMYSAPLHSPLHSVPATAPHVQVTLVQQHPHQHGTLETSPDHNHSNSGEGTARGSSGILAVGSRSSPLIIAPPPSTAGTAATGTHRMRSSSVVTVELPPSWDALSQLVREALMHLRSCNIIKLLSPWDGSTVYATTKAFHEILKSPNHPARIEIGSYMLRLGACKVKRTKKHENHASRKKRRSKVQDGTAPTPLQRSQQLGPSSMSITAAFGNTERRLTTTKEQHQHQLKQQRRAHHSSGIGGGSIDTPLQYSSVEHSTSKPISLLPVSSANNSGSTRPPNPMLQRHPGMTGTSLVVPMSAPLGPRPSPHAPPQSSSLNHLMGSPMIRHRDGHTTASSGSVNRSSQIAVSVSGASSVPSLMHSVTNMESGKRRLTLSVDVRGGITNNNCRQSHHGLRSTLHSHHNTSDDTIASVSDDDEDASHHGSTVSSSSSSDSNSSISGASSVMSGGSGQSSHLCNSSRSSSCSSTLSDANRSPHMAVARSSFPHRQHTEEPMDTADNTTTLWRSAEQQQQQQHSEAKRSALHHTHNIVDVDTSSSTETPAAATSVPHIKASAPPPSSGQALEKVPPSPTDNNAAAVRLASSAALCALGKFAGGSSADAVRSEMKLLPAWSFMFNKWSVVCCKALVELAILNDWLEKQ